jgi:hypothetical protein
VRLLIASVDKAREIGIDWWQNDPALCSGARKSKEEKDQLVERINRLEALLAHSEEAPQRVFRVPSPAPPAKSPSRD